MSAHLQTLFLALTVGFVYWWLHTPALNYYSLQVFALTVALYFVLKRLTRSKIWHLAPKTQSFEMILATFAFLIIIGYTGNLNSVLFSLTYVHLFFLVFSTQISTSIIISALIIVFHYAQAGTDSTRMLSVLITIPILTVFFLFSKRQYDEVQKEKRIVSGEEKALAQALEHQRQLTHLITNFIAPKLGQIKGMSLNAAQNRDAILGQIFILQMEINRFIESREKEEF